MVASLPVFVNVAVPQLAMKIAAAQRKTFRDTSVEFICRSFKLPILRRSGLTCQDSRTAASSGSESGSFGVNLYCSVIAEVASALLPVMGTPNAARFITIMTRAKRYSPIVNPMAACIAKIQPSQIQRVLLNQMKMG